MPKLKTIRPRVSAIKPLIGRLATPTREAAEAERHRQRDRVQPWRAWYKTARWQKLRMSVLVRDLFTCQMKGCCRIEADTSQLVADHKIPHHGDETLFWNENNLQCLCKSCHDKLKQKEERAQAR